MSQDVAEQKAQQVEEAMRAAGENPEERVAHDYFGFDETKRVPLPDGVSWVEFKVMNEGQRRKYLNEQNRDVTISKVSGDAKLRTAPGDERHSLLKNTIVNWSLVRGGEQVPFSKPMLDKFLEAADPRVVDIIEKEVRKAHPWLLQDMTPDDIRQEISNLEEMLKVAEEREQGNVSS